MLSFFKDTSSTLRPTNTTPDSAHPSIANQDHDQNTDRSPQTAEQARVEPLPQFSLVPDGPVYTPLPQNSIRLLKLRYGHVTSPVECELTTFAIEEAPTYDALSYVWGLESSSEPIICNGHRMPIRNNLMQALRHLRPLPSWVAHDIWPETHALHSSHNAWKGIARNRNEMPPDDKFQQNFIWVDSLCINQADTAEREEQVKLMDRIFSRAETVKVWLGPADTSQIAVQPLNTERVPNIGNGLLTVSGHFARQRPVYHLLQYGTMPLVLAFIAQAIRNVEGAENYLAKLRPPWDLVHRNKAYGLLSPSADEWTVLRKFLTNSWFDRVWIVQEIVLARRAVVIVGDWQLEWAALGQAAAWFEDHGYGMPANYKFSRVDRNDLLPVAKAAAMWRLNQAIDKRWPLLQMLAELRSRNATDEKDKLYATYSMAHETETNSHGLPFLLEPTYSSAPGNEEACAKVYRDLARFLIIEHGDLSVLSHVEQTRVMRSAEWPSWVPDWRQVKASAEFIKHNLDASWYNANDGKNMVIGDSLDPNSLSLQGVRAAVVNIYSEKLSSYGFRHITYQDECQFVKSAWNLYITSLAGGKPTKEGLRVFLSTLTAGLTDEQMAVNDDPGFFSDAKAWLAENTPDVPLFHSLGEGWFAKQRRARRNPHRFQAAFTRACSDRAFFIASGGSLGIGPETMRSGDIVVVLFGGRVPYVLRPLRDGDYSFIGECYVHHFMDGEVIRKWQGNNLTPDFFCLR
ncbi:heterokaryon incompatibility protein [Colletotrichum truncatum]|uniref:Heterokaryon incompatibility protein n=1 Tax=Colletotrichum truncatum TaxID=5467 RepID=A0ACC3ZHZ5_COLTU|nr:heterokaryon incompatibility protein [Colletotrichum truncatum]KAF6782282.1 heterokaryon incompatibility protein [Colletotrichum truncatum]